MSPGQKEIALQYLADEAAEIRHRAQHNALMAGDNADILDECDARLQIASALDAVLDLVRHYQPVASDNSGDDTRRIVLTGSVTQPATH